MKRTTLFLFFLLFISISSIAKDRFLSGYIINTAGDTIRGYILAQPSIKASEKCIFKITLDGVKQEYNSSDLYGYRLDEGKFYISKEIKTYSNQNSKRVFLEFFIKGITSVYYYVDDNGDQNKGGEHYFIEKEGFGMIELSEPDKFYDSVHGVPSKYHGKLRSIMADCPQLTNEINRTSLNYKSLTKLSKDYHQMVCTSEACIIYEKSPSKSQINFGIIAGTTYNKYSFGVDVVSDYQFGYQLGASVNFRNILLSNSHIEFNCDFILEHQSKYSLTSPLYIRSLPHLEYNGVPYRLFKEGTFSSEPSAVSKLDVDLKIYSFKIPLIIGYRWDLNKYAIHTGLGITNKFIFSNNKNFKYQEFEQQYNRTISPYLVGYIGKFGIERILNNKHTIQINLGYEYLTDPFAVNQVLRLNETCFSAQFVYFL